MKKNDIFTFTAPNGVEVTAVVVDKVADEIPIATHIERWLCYAQNRLFTYEESYNIFHEDRPSELKYGKVLVDYAILPDYDRILEDYQHQIDIVNDYADKNPLMVNQDEPEIGSKEFFDQNDCWDAIGGDWQG